MFSIVKWSTCIIQTVCIYLEKQSSYVHIRYIELIIFQILKLDSWFMLNQEEDLMIKLHIAGTIGKLLKLL